MATIMNKTKYIRTSSGGMMPIYSHSTDDKNSAPIKTSSLKVSKKAVKAKNSNSKD